MLRALRSACSGARLYMMVALMASASKRPGFTGGRAGPRDYQHRR